MKIAHTWLVTNTVYGLVNANAKWQNYSDQVLKWILQPSLRKCRQVPRLFCLRRADQLVIVVAKLIDNIKAAGVENTAMKIIEVFHEWLKPGSISSRPENMHFFRIDTCQDADMNNKTEASDNLDALTEYYLSRRRHN